MTELPSVGKMVNSGAAQVRNSLLRRVRRAKSDLALIVNRWDDGARIWYAGDGPYVDPKSPTFKVDWRYRKRAEYPENMPGKMANDATTLRAVAGRLTQLADDLDKRAAQLWRNDEVRAAAEQQRTLKALKS